MTKRRTKINARQKGKRGERAVAKMLSAWWGAEFTSTPMSGGFATQTFREDWNAAGDIVTPDLDFPFTVEVKNCEGWHLEQFLTAEKCDLYSWWEQTVGETPPGKIPLLLFTRNRQPWFVCVYADMLEHYNDVSDVGYAFHKDLSLTLRGLEDANGEQRPLFIGLAEDFMGTDPQVWVALGKKLK